MAQYILASQSPRRKQLLEWAEIEFEIIVHPTNETFPDYLSPEETAVHIAREKAKSILHSDNSGRIIIAADTIVVLNNEIIGKPRDREDAISILLRLNGKEHKVITAVTIVNKDKEISFYDTTLVRFHQLSKEQVTYYVDHYQPYDKAGAYAIQEWIGVVGIESINGDFYNVMGLPVSRVVRALREF